MSRTLLGSVALSGDSIWVFKQVDFCSNEVTFDGHFPSSVALSLDGVDGFTSFERYFLGNEVIDFAKPRDGS